MSFSSTFSAAKYFISLAFKISSKIFTTEITSMLIFWFMSGILLPTELKHYFWLPLEVPPLATFRCPWFNRPEPSLASPAGNWWERTESNCHRINGWFTATWARHVPSSPKFFGDYMPSYDGIS